MRWDEIAQIKVSNSPITNHTKKYCPSALLLFSISVYPKDKFHVDCFMGDGFGTFFFLPLAVVVVKKDFEGLTYVFPL